jgi:hypothetical protein
MDRRDWGKSLSEVLQFLPREFRENELAYLALTSKVELPVRDRMAYALYAAVEDESIHIAREWRRFDLAAVSKGAPQLLVELKAMYSFDMFTDNARTQYPDLVASDASKMHEFARTETDLEPEQFTLLLATHPKSLPSKELDWIVKYNPEIRRYHPLTVEAVQDAAAECFSEHPLYSNGELECGIAFGTEVSVLYWLFGDYKDAN